MKFHNIFYCKARKTMRITINLENTGIYKLKKLWFLRSVRCFSRIETGKNYVIMYSCVCTLDAEEVICDMSSSNQSIFYGISYRRVKWKRPLGFVILSVADLKRIRIPLDFFWCCFEKDFGGLCLSRYTYANEAAVAG